MTPTAQPIKAGRIFNAAWRRAQSLLQRGASADLEHCVALMQLSYTYLDAAHVQDHAALATQIARGLETSFAAGAADEFSPLVSDRPIAVLCSYPRSGNTVAIRLVAALLEAQVLENMRGSMMPFSKRLYPRSYPFVRLIKDHVARPIYRSDPTVFIIRDGRDTVISLAYMTLQQGLHNFTKRHELASFIRWLDSSYAFGGWARFMAAVAGLRDAGHPKLVVRYEDFMASSDALRGIVSFIDPDHAVPSSTVTDLWNNREAIFETIRDSDNANATWGIGQSFEPDSLFYHWSLNRKASSWRASWDAEARKAFHDTGATEHLVKYGYETRPDWWSNP